MRKITKIIRKTKEVVLPPTDVEEDIYEDPPMRSREEIGAAAKELDDRVWHDRHQVRMQNISDGSYTMEPQILKGALREAKRIEAKYGRDTLGPYTKYDWGTLNGKLSALRWVCGDRWDNLDT